MSGPEVPLKLALLMDPLEEGWPSMDLAAELTADYFSCNGGINQNGAVPGAILRIAVHDESPEEFRKLLATQFVR